VQRHVVTSFAEAAAAAGADLPQVVKDAFNALLECGILARGFEATPTRLTRRAWPLAAARAVWC
jgi:hypothetical protein